MHACDQDYFRGTNQQKREPRDCNEGPAITNLRFPTFFRFLFPIQSQFQSILYYIMCISPLPGPSCNLLLWLG